MIYLSVLRFFIILAVPGMGGFHFMICTLNPTKLVGYSTIFVQLLQQDILQAGNHCL